MQLLFDCSDEGVSGGLGIIPGRVCRLPGDTTSGHVRIPHMGWNTVCVEKDSLLTASLDARSRFYFVHSFAAVPSDSRDVLGRTIHGEPFVSMVEHGGVCGVQFHPEKSHRHGAALLRAFLSL